MSIFIALASGLLFGVGLVAGGMTDPSKVQGFLDLFGRWDPSLAFVMGWCDPCRKRRLRVGAPASGGMVG